MTSGAGTSCEVIGMGRIATQVQCADLGELLRLDAATVGASIGGRVHALGKSALQPEPTTGGQAITLSVQAISYQLDVTPWTPIELEARGAIINARIAQREQGYQTLPTCPAGEVVVAYDSCGPTDGYADVCGPPTWTCGAALASGHACTHNAACASARCGLVSATCE